MLDVPAGREVARPQILLKCGTEAPADVEKRCLTARLSCCLHQLMSSTRHHLDAAKMSRICSVLRRGIQPWAASVRPYSSITHGKALSKKEH